jgi:hypothetical protein
MLLGRRTNHFHLPFDRKLFLLFPHLAAPVHAG